MGLMSALSAATSGLRATQSGIELVSQNIANADSIGYTRRRGVPVENLNGERGIGVRFGEVERVLNLMTQRQLRIETSGAAYTSYAAGLLAQVDRLFGTPGSDVSLDSSVDAFTQSLQALSSNPSSLAARTGALNAGGALAAHLSAVSEGVQELRTDAEGRIGSSVSRANTLLQGIADVNQRIIATGGNSAALLDERDRMILGLSELMDVEVRNGQHGSVTLMTGGGLTLFNGATATKLSFDGRGALGPTDLFSSDPALRGTGTITATFSNGGTIDVVAGGMIRSGEIAAALRLRDETLPQTQRQLDELAAGLARALSDHPDRVDPVTTAGGSGYDIDMSGLAEGDAAAFDFRLSGGAAQRVIVVPMNGATPVTSPGVELSDPEATIIRVDVSGGTGPALASLQTQLSAAFPGRFTTSVTGDSFRVLGAGGTTQLLGANVTSAALASGDVALPFFVDGGRGNAPYLGGAVGGQIAGLAQRLAVNPALAADPAKLVVYDPGPPATPQGDATRPQFLFDALTRTSLTFTAASSVGGVTAPFSGTLVDFAQRVIESQGAQAAQASRLDEGQTIALANIEERFSSESGVSIDQEMAQLVQLQTAYGANARVLSAVRDMLDTLMRI